MTSFTHIQRFHASRTHDSRERSYGFVGSSQQHGRVARSSLFSRILTVLLLVFLSLCLLAPDAFAAGSDIGKNVGGLLRGYATELYGGIVAAFSLVFLWNRRYVELATFLFAAVVVAWMVFSPDQIGKAAEAIGKQIFG